MLEPEWIEASDPLAALEFFDGLDLLTERKQRLFDCACVRRIWHLILDRSCQHAVETAERYADGFVSLEQLRNDQARALIAADEQSLSARLVASGGSISFTAASPSIRRRLDPRNSYSALLAAAQTAWEFRGGVQPQTHAAEAFALSRSPDASQRSAKTRRGRLRSEMSAQIHLILEIFGQPWRRFDFRPECRTSDTVAIAQTMYDSRDFTGMPVLADALEEAGCTCSQVLHHCRKPGCHVRGCWVVDLVLGKE